MNVTQCDGCGLQSPDENGLFIANHWTSIKYTEGHKDRSVGRIPRKWREKDICQECAEKFKKIFA